MSTDPYAENEGEALDKWARSFGMSPEMVCRVAGNEPVCIGADPVGGWIYFGIVVRTLDGLWFVHSLAKWSCVQGENFKTAHDRAMQLVESGVGSMR